MIRLHGLLKFMGMGLGMGVLWCGAELLHAEGTHIHDAEETHLHGETELCDTVEAHDHRYAEAHNETEAHDHRDAEAHNETEAHDHAEEAPVILTAAQRALIHVQVAEVRSGDVEARMRLTGEVRLNREETAQVMPSLPGFVTKILVKEGDKVAKGQVLAVLTSHKLGEYYSNYNLAVEQETLTRSEYTRAERLIKEDALSEKDYLRYKREYKEAEIARQHAEALLRSLLVDPTHSDHFHEQPDVSKICTEYELRAPLAGTILTKDVTLGENFPEDNAKVLFTVSNLEALWLELQATTAELRQLKVGQEVTIRVPATYQMTTGTLCYIAPTIDEQMRVGKVRVLVENKDGLLRPGQFVTGEIQIDSGAATLFVPREAVQLLDGETVVFVPQGEGFAPKPVTVGKTANGVTQILAGLHAHERVVEAGAFELKSILLTSGMDPHAGHGH